MKKIALFLILGIFAIAFQVSAQNATPPATTPTPVKMDTTALKEYIGKYKMKDAPFEFVNVTIKDGKLWGEAEGQGSAELAPTKDTDVFEVVGYGGSVTFTRTDDKKLKGCILNIQGNNLEGEKQK